MIRSEITLKNRNGSTQCIAENLGRNPDLTIANAFNIIEMRMNTEIAQHRPVSEFYDGASNAH